MQDEEKNHAIRAEECNESKNRRSKITVEENDLYWYWFVNIPTIGLLKRQEIMEKLGHPYDFFHAPEEFLKANLTPKQFASYEKHHNIDNVQKSMNMLKESNTLFVHWESPAYPEGFREIPQPPHGFYVRGQLPDLRIPILSIVGSRSASEYGMKIAREFSRSLSEKGIQIISGLAAGIDTQGHMGALDAGGYTMGILGGGIDTIYPRENFNLYMELYECGGVMSEYNLGIPNHAGLFPLRNRLISALSDGIFVVEAREKSGSLITADQGLDQGKEIFALPGRISDPLSKGCNNLISQGATLVQSAEEIYQVLSEKHAFYETYATKHNSVETILEGDKQKSVRMPSSKEEQYIYNLIDPIIPVSFDELRKKSEYNMEKLHHILINLELGLFIFEPERNMYIRSFL